METDTAGGWAYRRDATAPASPVMGKDQVIGLDVPATLGQRVIMSNPRDRWRGPGIISSVHASGQYCSVNWQSGQRDVCLFTGMQNEFHLVAVEDYRDSHAERVPFDSVRPLYNAAPRVALPEGYKLSLPIDDMLLSASHTDCVHCERIQADNADLSALESYLRESSYAKDNASDLHQRILAQEVVKLRAEVSRLQAKPTRTFVNDGSLEPLRDDILLLQAYKAETIEKRERDKILLKRQIAQLLLEAENIRSGRKMDPGCLEQMEETLDMHEDDCQMLVEEAILDKDFASTLRAMRQDLMTSIHDLSKTMQEKHSVKSLLKLSNERLQRVIGEATQLPVTSRLHLEALRLIAENAQLRKSLNGFAEQFLAVAAARRQLHRMSLQTPGHEKCLWEEALLAGEQHVGWRASPADSTFRGRTEKHPQDLQAHGPYAAGHGAQSHPGECHLCSLREHKVQQLHDTQKRMAKEAMLFAQCKADLNELVDSEGQEQKSPQAPRALKDERCYMDEAAKLLRAVQEAEESGQQQSHSCSGLYFDEGEEIEKRVQKLQDLGAPAIKEQMLRAKLHSMDATASTAMPAKEADPGEGGANGADDETRATGSIKSSISWPLSPRVANVYDELLQTAKPVTALDTAGKELSDAQGAEGSDQNTLAPKQLLPHPPSVRLASPRPTVYHSKFGSSTFVAESSEGGTARVSETHRRLEANFEC